MPLGYAVRDKKLVVVEEEAERVRLIFQLYLELGSLGRLLPELRRRGVVTKRRRAAHGGRVIGGIPFTRGPLAYLLRNRFYLGEVVYRGKVSQGEHAADPGAGAVRRRAGAAGGAASWLRPGAGGLAGAAAGSAVRRSRQPDEPDPCQQAGRALPLLCLLRPGAGSARGSGLGRPGRGSRRSSSRCCRRCASIVPISWPAPDRELIERCVERVVLHPTAIEITLRTDPSAADRDQVDAAGANPDAATAVIAEHLCSGSPGRERRTKRRREIIAPAQSEHPDHRPIRAETRATLVRAIALGRRWLDELISGAVVGPEAIASREGCSRRHVNMTISLAFLAPDLVRAAVEGRLPRGVGVSRLIDPPIEWPRQWQMLGLQP